MLSPKTIVKLRAAQDLQVGLKPVVAEVLEDHMFFNPSLLEMSDFWARFYLEVELSEKMKEAYEDKDPVRFQPFLDDVQERIHSWYCNHFVELLELMNHGS